MADDRKEGRSVAGRAEKDEEAALRIPESAICASTIGE